MSNLGVKKPFSAACYGLKTLCSMKRMNALPAVLFSDEALMQWVGFNAQQVRTGVCQRGAAKRQGARQPGPICPETLAKPIVRLNLRELESVFHGAIRTLARAGGFEAQVTGIVDGTALETTEHSTGCGQVTWKRRLEDTRGQAHEIKVTVYGWKVLLLIDAITKIPLAVKVGKIHEHETHWTRALVTQARANLVGHTRLHKVVFDKGFLDGTDLWWPDQQGLRCVVPAKTNMTVTADARAQAAAGEGITVGRRVHTVRHGRGKTASTERLETEVVGITGLTTYDQYGTPAHGRQHHRRDFQAHPINAAVRVHVLFTLLLFALATAYRLPCEREALGGEAVGWQCWRRQLLEQTRDQVIVFAQGYYGIFHLAEYSLLLGVKLKDVPPEVGSRQQVLAKLKLPAGG
jgi:hypothetical protein